MKHEESIIQQICVRWFRESFPQLAKLLLSIPNGGYRRPREGEILKLEGQTAGAADLMLLVPNKRYHALFIEMKTESGKQSKLQRLWQYEVEKVGYRYVICRSVESFQDIIIKHITDGD